MFGENAGQSFDAAERVSDPRAVQGVDESRGTWQQRPVVAGDLRRQPLHAPSGMQSVSWLDLATVGELPRERTFVASLKFIF